MNDAKSAAERAAHRMVLLISLFAALFLVSTAAVVDKRGNAGRFFCATGGQHEFTGERLRLFRSEAYRLCVSLLAEGLGVIRIGKLRAVFTNPVMSVREREVAAVDTEKRKLATESLGVVLDHALVTSGEATARLENEVKEPGHESFNDYMAGLKRVTATCSGRETTGQKALAAPGAEAAAGPGTDTESGATPGEGTK
jgi:hypothetical protein